MVAQRKTLGLGSSKSKSAEDFINAARKLEDKGLIDRAISQLKQGTEQNLTHALIWAKLGRLQMTAFQYDDAVKSFQQSLNSDSELEIAIKFSQELEDTLVWSL